MDIIYPGENMNELQGNSKGRSSKKSIKMDSGKESGEGLMMKKTSQKDDGMKEKNCNAEICGKEISHAKTKKKNKGKNQGILADLKNVKSVTSCILIDNRQNLFSTKEDFLADSFICYICLVHESVNSLVHHLDTRGHKAKESLINISKRDIKIIICKGCKIMLIGVQYMINQHFATNFHKNLNGKNQKSNEDSYYTKKKYELIVKGLVCVPPIYRKDLLLDIFEVFGQIKKISVSEFKCSIFFKDSWLIKKQLSHNIKVDGFKLKLQWKEVNEFQFLCDSSVLAELSNSDKLFEKLKDLIEEHKIVYAQGKEKEACVCESILNSVEKSFPGAICYIFGSRLTGLSSNESDLDIYLDCGGFYYGDMCYNETLHHSIIKTLPKCLGSSPEFTQITVIGKARVPLVKVRHIETNICCDISFNNGLAVENSAMIKFMVSIDERTKPMLLFVKHWMKKNNFCGRPHFSSYGITLLVLYYLAQFPNPVLPTINDLRSRRKGPGKFIANWDCSFLVNRNAIPKTKNRDSIPQLLLGFFSFYETFDFNKNAISPLTGSHITREDFQKFKMTGFPYPYSNLSNVRSLSSLWNPSDAICVMDPFDLSHNLTHNFPKKSLKKFSYLCSLSAHLLSETLLHRNHDFLN